MSSEGRELEVDGPARITRSVPPGPAIAIAVTCVSSSAILVRWCESGVLAIAFWRLALAAALLWLPALVSGRARRERIRATCSRWAVLAGLALAVHFGLWIGSLGLTSVAASTFLLSIQVPVAGVVSWLVLREPPGGRALAGMAACLAGIGVLASATPDEGGTLAGNLLALGAGVTYVAYVGTGRSVRSRVPIFCYLPAVYTWAACGMAAVAVLAGKSLRPAVSTDWLWLALLAVVPTLGGHGLFNHALARVRVYVVNLAVMGEPVMASLLAWALLAEPPPARIALAAPLILGGAALAILDGVAPATRPVAGGR